MRTCRALIPMVVLASFVAGNLDIRPGQLDVYYRHTCGETGSVSIAINGNDFPGASPQTPNYICVRFDKEAVLCQTLVDLEQSGIEQSVPIALAMSLEGSSSSGFRLIAPPSTVAIVRWRKGEGEFWLRITQPSTGWVVDQAGSAVTPSGDNRVVWSWGITARNSWARNEMRFAQEQANLPGNTRWPEQALDPENDPRGWIISTLVCLDLTQSTVQPMPLLGSALEIDLSYFDEATSGVTTASNPGSIIHGNPLFATFFPQYVIAYAYDEEFGPVAFQNAVDPMPVLCPENVTVQPDLVPAAFTIDANGSCFFSWGSYLSLHLPDQSAGFFLVHQDSSGQPVLSHEGMGQRFYEILGVNGTWAGESVTAVTDETDMFFDGGRWLSQEIRLVYSAPGSFGSISIEGAVFGRVGGVTETLDMATRLWLSIDQDPIDDPPFDGTLDDGNPHTGVTREDQARGCIGEPFVYFDGAPVTFEFVACGAAVPTLGNAGRTILIIGLIGLALMVGRVKGQKIN